MSRDGTVIPFRQPEAIDDPLTEVAREGARRMLAQVLIAEADAFVAQWKDLKLPDGRDRVVRHGHGPQRAIQTGVGPIEVRRAKVRDRADVAAGANSSSTSGGVVSRSHPTSLGGGAQARGNALAGLQLATTLSTARRIAVVRSVAAAVRAAGCGRAVRGAPHSDG